MTEKVSFNIASEVGYVYILASFWNPKTVGQTVLPDRSVLKKKKIAEKCQN